MADDYTPTDDEVMEAWAAHNSHDLPTVSDLVSAYDTFRRWLAEHDAKVRAESLREAREALIVDQISRYGIVLPDVDDAVDLLAERADRIEKEADQ